MSQTEELSRREEQFLENVLENLRQRIRKIAQELEEGQKDIESMHDRPRPVLPELQSHILFSSFYPSSFLITSFRQRAGTSFTVSFPATIFIT